MTTDHANLGLPVEPPVAPMLASPGGDTVPRGEALAYEPKWDGFRTIIFRAGDRVVVQGRSGDDLAYAFPEVVAAARQALPERIVIDGELVVIAGGSLDFPAMGARIRPRSEAGGASIAALAQQSPATFIAFDLLALGDICLLDEAYDVRRGRLESVAQRHELMRITPATYDHAQGVEWFSEFEGGGLDGVIVKDRSAPYTPGKRTLTKIKHARTLDVVVAGWRGHSSNPEEVGSLLLGLFEGDLLHHIGVASGFSAALRRDLTADLAAATLGTDAEHPWRVESAARRPGAINRWSRGRGQAWHALPCDRVAEVAYDQFEGDRLRHVARWLRWRPDRTPGSCTVEQMPALAPINVNTLWR